MAAVIVARARVRIYYCDRANGVFVGPMCVRAPCHKFADHALGILSGSFGKTVKTDMIEPDGGCARRKCYIRKYKYE